MQNKELILNKILIIVFAMLLTLPALLLKIEIDGDLYKASVILPIYREDETAPETEETDEKEE